MYDEGMTTDQCGRHRPEASVVGMSIEAEREAPTDTTVVDEVDQDPRLEETADIGAEALEAVIWTTKPTFQCHEDILGTFQRFR